MAPKHKFNHPGNRHQKRACSVNFKKSPIFGPKGCTTKKGVHVNGKFISSKGKSSDAFTAHIKKKKDASTSTSTSAPPPADTSSSSPPAGKRRITPQMISPSPDIMSPSFGNSSTPGRNSSKTRIEGMIARYESLKGFKEAHKKGSGKKAKK